MLDATIGAEQTDSRLFNDLYGTLPEDIGTLTALTSITFGMYFGQNL
jgi:hypothetical protein